MRYLLDTCIMLYMLNESGEMSNDVEAVVTDGASCICVKKVVSLQIVKE